MLVLFPFIQITLSEHHVRFGITHVEEAIFKETLKKFQGFDGLVKHPSNSKSQHFFPSLWSVFVRYLKLMLTLSTENNQFYFA